MKRISLFITIVIAMVLTACGPRTFNDLRNVDGVSMFYASPILMKIASAPLSKMPGIDLSKITDHIDDLRIITAETPIAKKKTQSVVLHEIDHIKARPLLEMFGGDFTTKGNGVYVTKSGADSYSHIVIVTSYGTQYSALFLSGNFTASDIKTLGL